MFKPDYSILDECIREHQNILLYASMQFWKWNECEKDEWSREMWTKFQCLFDIPFADAVEDHHHDYSFMFRLNVDWANKFFSGDGKGYLNFALEPLDQQAFCNWTYAEKNAYQFIPSQKIPKHLFRSYIRILGLLYQHKALWQIKSNQLYLYDIELIIKLFELFFLLLSIISLWCPAELMQPFLEMMFLLWINQNSVHGFSWWLLSIDRMLWYMWRRKSDE